jgi:hypothetical protein
MAVAARFRQDRPLRKVRQDMTAIGRKMFRPAGRLSRIDPIPSSGPPVPGVQASGMHRKPAPA